MYFYSSYDVTPIYVYTHLRFKLKSNVNQNQRVVRNVTLTANLWKKLIPLVTISLLILQEP